MTPRALHRVTSRVLAAAFFGGALTLGHAPSSGEPRPARAPISTDAPVFSPGQPPSITRSATATSSMSTVRWLHAGVPLGDGRILVAGGKPTGETMTSAEIFDPATGSWTKAPPMLFAHDWPVASPMCDGRVFVSGHGGGASDAEIYDPVANQWTPAGKTKYGHIYGQATLLQDCRILLSGGYDAKNFSEVYDPAAGTFKFAGSMTTSRFFHSTTRLLDGRVLAAGGGVDDFGVWYTYDYVDVWDPATGKWKPVKPMVDPRRAHTATLLPDGRVLVAGGTVGGKNDATEGGEQLGTAEIYDPIANLWEKLPSKLVTPRGLHTAAIMPSGAVVLFGGLDATGSASREVEAYHQGAWQPLEPLIVDRFHHASAPLADGSVLVAGGVHQATAEIYALGQPGDPCGSDVVCAGGICADGVCCNEACDTGCRRCDVSGREGTCSVPCTGADYALACPDGGSTCASSACVAVPCSPYRCDAEQGVCRDGCQSVDDCATGQACDVDGRCVPPPDVSASDEGPCSLSIAGPRAGGPWSALVVAVAAIGAALARRRRRRYGW